MPELPEVETTRRGIAPHVCGQTIENVILRTDKLRFPIPANVQRDLRGKQFTEVARRGKYLLLSATNGTAIIHLGMSGKLRIVNSRLTPIKHDHVDIVFANQQCLRFNDPRRFGALLWTTDDPLQHSLLSKLGPEPLTREFNGHYLFTKSRQRKAPVKAFIMDSHVVVGVGNIYATEALFKAGIHPKRAAGRISEARYIKLTKAIKVILRAAIKQGGTTLKDFLNSDGKPGYFKQRLNVYGRAGEPCLDCGTTLKSLQLGQRTSVYCPSCQR